MAGIGQAEAARFLRGRGAKPSPTHNTRPFDFPPIGICRDRALYPSVFNPRFFPCLRTYPAAYTTYVKRGRGDANVVSLHRAYHAGGNNHRLWSIRGIRSERSWAG